MEVVELAAPAAAAGVTRAPGNATVHVPAELSPRRAAGAGDAPGPTGLRRLVVHRSGVM